jgi:hypothetical protein
MEVNNQHNNAGWLGRVRRTGFHFRFFLCPFKELPKNFLETFDFKKKGKTEHILDLHSGFLQSSLRLCPFHRLL